MNSGKLFEQQFKKSVPEDVYCIRLKDAATFGNYSNNTQDAMFDFICFDGSKLYCLELKTTKHTSVSVALSKDDKAMLRYKQIQALQKSLTYPNVVSGIIVDFQNGGCFFISINDLMDIINQTGKKSFNEKDIKGVAIEISKKKMRVNYKYDLSVLFR